MIIVKSPREIALMKEAGEVLIGLFDVLEANTKPDKRQAINKNNPEINFMYIILVIKNAKLQKMIFINETFNLK